MIKEKNYMVYLIAYVKIQKMKIYYPVKPTAQLVFKNRFPKGGPTCCNNYDAMCHYTDAISCYLAPDLVQS